MLGVEVEVLGRRHYRDQGFPIPLLQSLYIVRYENQGFLTGAYTYFALMMAWDGSLIDRNLVALRLERCHCDPL